jgi:hypothetical protein
VGGAMPEERAIRLDIVWVIAFLGELCVLRCFGSGPGPSWYSAIVIYFAT